MVNIQNSTKIYLAGAVLGLLFSVLLYAIQPVRWEAQALILNRNSNASYNVDVNDAIPIVLARLKSSSFRLAVTKRAKTDGVADILNEDKCACLIVKQIKNSGALNISVVGRTPELAKATVEAIVEELKANNSAMLDYYISRINYRISVHNREMETISRSIDLLTNRINTSQDKAGETESLSKIILIMDMRANLEKKKEQSIDLQEHLDFLYNRGTELLEPVFVKEKRLFFSLWRVCLFGALLGAFFSVLWVQWKR